MSLMMHRLLLYPDHPFDIGEIWGKRFDPQTKLYERFLVTAAPDLSKDVIYPKERRLIEDIRAELRHGRHCQVYATFTGEFDVAARLETVLRSAGFRVAVLRSSVPTLQREEWYERQLKQGVEVVICHPKLVETGLDLLAFPTLYFYETGYSLHTLRQASRRSWRIGQHHPVRVKFLVNMGTTQTTCLRLMGKKMLVALMIEGKFSGEGIHSLESDDDLMSAMARELVERGHVGESADAVWADLKRERDLQLPSRPANPSQDAVAVTEETLAEMPLFLLQPVPEPPDLTLVHAASKPKQKPSTLWPTGHAEGKQMLSLRVTRACRSNPAGLIPFLPLTAARRCSMTQEEIDARRRQLAEEYLALHDGSSGRGLQIAYEFGVLSEQERRLQRSGDKPPLQAYVQDSEERPTRLALAEAKSLAKRMGLSNKTVTKPKLGPGMQQDAVFLWQATNAPS